MVSNTNITMSDFDRGTLFDSDSYDGIYNAIDLQGDARHVAKIYTTLSSTFIPVGSHSSFVFYLSRLDLLPVFHLPCCRIVYPLLYMWFFQGHGPDFLVIIQCDGLPKPCF